MQISYEKLLKQIAEHRADVRRKGDIGWSAALAACDVIMQKMGNMNKADKKAEKKTPKNHLSESVIFHAECICGKYLSILGSGWSVDFSGSVTFTCSCGKSIKFGPSDQLISPNNPLIPPGERCPGQDQSHCIAAVSSCGSCLRNHHIVLVDRYRAPTACKTCKASQIDCAVCKDFSHHVLCSPEEKKDANA